MLESFATVTPQGRAITDLFLVALAISFAILLLVYGLMAVVLRRYRGRPGDPEPPQVAGNRRLELLWTATPSAVLLVMFVATVSTMRTVYPAVPPADALRVQVIGHQWWWEFVYPDLGVTTANELHAPVGASLQLEIQGADVVHSFWVPALGWKRDAVPGKTNVMFVRVDQPGIYDGACTEFCGVQHAWMRIRFVAEPAAQFQTWVQGQRLPPASATDPGTGGSGQVSLVAQGQQVFQRTTCITCHRVQGTTATAGVGPDLSHLGSRSTLGAGVVANTPENLRAWVRNARAIKPGVLMPPYALSDADLDALVAYLGSLT
jgi:cytochrome c oxidase subunit 2